VIVSHQMLVSGTFLFHNAVPDGLASRGSFLPEIIEEGPSVTLPRFARSFADA